jgi:hypothetical protein
MTGVVTSNGAGSANSVNGTSMWVTGGNLMISSIGAYNFGLKVANANCIMDFNGNPITFSGGYTNANVEQYLSNASVSGGRFANAIYPSSITTTTITTGANITAGAITGNWSLTAGSRLNATYADLAERFEADTYYDPGTVVEMGGDKEITAVQDDLSEEVFGVVSDTAAYLMNSGAGSDITHPPIAVGGRVKVKVTGKVKKGERLVSAGQGIARAAIKGEATAFNIIGRSLENKTTDDIGKIEAFVKIN